MNVVIKDYKESDPIPGSPGPHGPDHRCDGCFGPAPGYALCARCRGEVVPLPPSELDVRIEKCREVAREYNPPQSKPKEQEPIPVAVGDGGAALLAAIIATTL